ncbi:TPA: hypothetical protein GDO54_018624 [Pyxicephalus adspersus]|uniref:Taste receptor type 2 n=1 Tax=Pyxicephalus adspersus TaxID=30357 RepID=A0AAV2ZF73_PYXAD|nr:TPA: hypothetical protein GDO54_018624 [Pyxicephalus adspersus]
MISLPAALCLSVIVLEVITGLCSNIFIIFSLIHSGRKEKYFPPYNSILIALCVSNIGYTILMSANHLLSIFYPSVYNVSYTMAIINYMTLYSITSSSWLTCSLCIFYFIKIVQFNAGFIAWIKTKIETIVPWMILMVELISLSGSFLSLFVHKPRPTENSTMSTANVSSEYDRQSLTLVIVILIVISLPFSVSVFCMAISAWFLKWHSQYIKKNMRASEAGVKDYRRAVQTMFYLILFYALIYLVTLLLGLLIFDNHSLGYWMSMIVLLSFSMVQSSLLISCNPKLKEAWRQLFTCTETNEAS